MEKFFHWIDGGSYNAVRSQEYLDQLDFDQSDEPGQPIDELRLDPLVDAYADLFFPWITVLMAEPKYFFLAPAITEAVVKRLRTLGANEWSRSEVFRQAKVELRLAEACLCLSLLAKRKDKPRVIGIEKIKGVTVRPVTRKALGNDRGVAAGINMHVVPRYLGRTARLFLGELQQESALEIIVDRAHEDGPPTYWWENTDLADFTGKYSHALLRWLNEGQQDDAIKLRLTKSEAKLLDRVLFGNNERNSSLNRHQRLLKKTVESFDPKNRDLATSVFLKKLAASADRDDKPELRNAANICRAVGLVRLAYKALLADERDNEYVIKQLKSLPRLVLPKSSSVAGKGLARDSMEFLHKCQIAPTLEKLYRCIYKRERDIKPTRQKLCMRNNQAMVKAKFRDEKAKISVVVEPPFRLRSVFHAVSTIQNRLRK